MNDPQVEVKDKRYPRKSHSSDRDPLKSLNVNHFTITTQQQNGASRCDQAKPIHKFRYEVGYNVFSNYSDDNIGPEPISLVKGKLASSQAKSSPVHTHDSSDAPHVPDKNNELRTQQCKLNGYQETVIPPGTSVDVVTSVTLNVASDETVKDPKSTLDDFTKVILHIDTQSDLNWIQEEYLLSIPKTTTSHTRKLKVNTLSGQIERDFQGIKLHFEVHAGQLMQISFYIIPKGLCPTMPEIMIGKDYKYLGIIMSRDLSPFLHTFKLPDDAAESLECFRDSATYTPHDDKTVKEFMNFIEPLVQENLTKNGAIPGDIGSFKLEYKDGVQLENVPNRPYNIPTGYREEFDRQLKEMLSDGIVEEIKDMKTLGLQLNWTCVNQNNKVRFCQNAVPLNNQLKDMPVNFKDIRTLLLQDFKTSKFYTRIDLKSAFYHMRFDWKPGEKVPYFRFEGVNYRFNRLPFGLKTAPMIFNQMMTTLFTSFEPFLLRYFDDLVIFSPTLEQHIKDVAAVMKVLNENEIRTNPLKCEWCTKSLKFLGVRLSEAGAAIDQERIKQLLDFPNPRSVKELQSFLGLLAFSKRFFPNLHLSISHLYDVLKDLQSETKEVRKTALIDLDLKMNAVKASIAQAIYLSPPPPANAVKMYIYTDASDTGIGAAIGYFENEKDFRIFDICARVLKQHEKGYNVSKKELLAINYATMYWDFHLLGREVQVFTDHAALAFDYRSTSVMHRTLAFWWSNLSRYQIKLAHVEGVHNGLADYISRAHVLNPEAKVTHKKGNQKMKALTNPPNSKESVPPMFNVFSTATIEAANKNFPTSLFDPSDTYTDIETEEHPWDDDDPDFDTDKMNKPMLDAAETVEEFHGDPVDEDIIKKIINHYSPLDGEDDPEVIDAIRKQVGAWAETNTLPPRIIDDLDERNLIMESLHSGHAHPQAMRAKMIMLGVTWKGAWRSCVERAARCEPCRRYNPQKITHPRLSPLLSSSPFRKVNMDFLGPVNIDKAQDRNTVPRVLDDPPTTTTKKPKHYYILVYVDVSTGYTILRLTTVKSADACKSALSSIFHEYGAPLELYSDQESSFKSKKLSDYLSSHKVKQRFSTTYTPRSNGTAERRVGIVKAMLEKMIMDGKFPYDEVVEAVRLVQFQMNSRLDRAPGHSPFFLIYGRYPNGLPGQESYNLVNSSFDLAEWCSQQNYVYLRAIPDHCAAKRERKLADIHTFESKQNTDHGDLELDQPVYLKNMVPKFGEYRWGGPYYICHVQTSQSGLPYRYKLRQPGKKAAALVPGLYPRDQLKVIKNDKLAKQIDEETLVLTHIYRTHCSRQSGIKWYLVRFLHDGSVEWIPEYNVGEGLVIDYMNIKEKHGKKCPNGFTLQLGVNKAIRPFLDGGSYTYDEDEDDKFKETPHWRIIRHDKVPEDAKSIWNFVEKNVPSTTVDQPLAQ